MRGLRPVAVLSLSVVAFAAAIAVERKEKEEEALERRVDQIFAAYDKPDSPGCALGVIRDGNFVYKKGYGAASLELGVALTPASVFYMGSVSKQFTAASVVLAAEQGFLSLDRKSTRLNSSHLVISYAVFCLKKKKTNRQP